MSVLYKAIKLVKMNPIPRYRTLNLCYFSKTRGSSKELKIVCFWMCIVDSRNWKGVFTYLGHK